MINAIKYRNFNGIFQDLPNEDTLKNYNISAGVLIKKSNLVAIEDDIPHMKSTQDIQIGEMLGWDYDAGQKESNYWSCQLFKRLFFDVQGKIIEDGYTCKYAFIYDPKMRVISEVK